jgi:DNA-directed RNA polymerase subunit K/omega
MSYNHVMLGEPKENPRIDVQKAIRLFGEEQYKLILIASARAREIHHKKNFKEKQQGALIRTGYKPINAALNEIIEGKLTPQGYDHGTTGQ